MKDESKTQAQLIDELAAHRRRISQLKTEVALLERVRDDVRESERRYRHLVQAATDVLWILDVSTLVLTYVSPSARAMFGYAPKEPVGSQLEDYLTPASRELLQQKLADERAAPPEEQRESRVLELECHRRDGTTFWSETQMTTRRDAEGRITRPGGPRARPQRQVLHRRPVGAPAPGRQCHPWRRPLHLPAG